MRAFAKSDHGHRICIIIVSCDRLLERDWCAPYGARATHAIEAFDQTPSQCFRRGDWPARLYTNMDGTLCVALTETV